MENNVKIKKLIVLQANLITRIIFHDLIIIIMLLIYYITTYMQKYIRKLKFK